MSRDRDDLAEERLHPAVRRAVDDLAQRDTDRAEAAEDAWRWVYGPQDPGDAARHELQTFLWYGLPAKWHADVVEHLAVARALGELCARLGLVAHARVCRGEATREILLAWDEDPREGFDRYERAMERSGLQPPDVPDLAWGGLQSLEEAAARAHVAEALEAAVDAGRLRPGARGWRSEQRRLTTAALHEPVPDFPGGQTWLQTVTTARLGSWMRGRGDNPLRRDLLRALEPLLLHPVASPAGTEAVVAPLRWLLRRAAQDGLPLTERGNLGRALVQEAAAVLGWEHETYGSQIRGEADLFTLPRWHELLRNQRWVQRRGRRLVATAAGRALVEDTATAWRGLCAAFAAASGFPGAAQESVLLLLHAAGDDRPTSAILHSRVAELLTEAGWRVAASTPVRAADAARVCGPFIVTLELFGLLEDRWGEDPLSGLRLTAVGRATALEILRRRATAPLHGP